MRLSASVCASELVGRALCGSELANPQVRAMVSSASLAAFLWTALPIVVLQCLGWSSTEDIERELLKPRLKHFAEFFCGTGGLVTALSQAGMRCTWFDIDVERSHDMLSVAGIAAAIRIALSVIPGGVVWFGVPCSTFVWMARGHTKRSRPNPLGDVARMDVRRANRIARLVALICQVLTKRGVFFVMEQPAGSLLWWTPCMRLAARRLRVQGEAWCRRFVWLGHYGHKICKPTELCGIFPSLARILPSRRPRSKAAMGVYKVWKNKNGRRRTSGSVGLKATEHYPKEFCREFAREVVKRISQQLG